MFPVCSKRSMFGPISTLLLEALDAKQLVLQLQHVSAQQAQREQFLIDWQGCDGDAKTICTSASIGLSSPKSPSIPPDPDAPHPGNHNRHGQTLPLGAEGQHYGLNVQRSRWRARPLSNPPTPRDPRLSRSIYTRWWPGEPGGGGGLGFRGSTACPREGQRVVVVGLQDSHQHFWCALEFWLRAIHPKMGVSVGVWSAIRPGPRD